MFRRIKYLLRIRDRLYTKFVFNYFGVIIGKNWRVIGLFKLRLAKSSKLIIGKHFTLNNGYSGNLIGRQQKSIIILNEDCEIVIGNNVGMSSISIIGTTKIIIGNNVKIGGNVCIYDTDFHSLDYRDRLQIPEAKANIKNRPITIGDNVFIGAHSTILKGVTIGNNSIVGACSVVSKNIPANEIWGGNPATFIKKSDNV